MTNLHTPFQEVISTHVLLTKYDDIHTKSVVTYFILKSTAI